MADQAIRRTLGNGAILELDPERPMSRFAKLITGPVIVQLSHTEAREVYELLHGYFVQPMNAPVELDLPTPDDRLSEVETSSSEAALDH